jgi:hypothetical protein
LEKAVGRRTGVRVESFRTESAGKAERSLLELLGCGQPAMLVLDMGYLPYFDFGGEEFHFGYHVVVACGWNPETRQVLLADRDEDLHPVTQGTLAQARGSKFQPFPPHNAWYTFDFCHARPPGPDEVRQAIRQCVRGMLAPPIANLGVKGIRKAAQRIRGWPKILGEESLRAACINTAIMIDSRGGTGGGLFRYMYGRFLGEAADITGEAGLRAAGEQMRSIGDCWQSVAGWFEQAYAGKDLAGALEQIASILPEIAGQEERVWSRLQEVLG